MTKQKVVEGRAKEALRVKKDKERERCRATDDQERTQGSIKSEKGKCVEG